jgi:hypothetical protein
VLTLSPIKIGDKVSTAKNAQAVFAVGRNAFLLRESSEVTLQGEGVLVNTLRVISGNILSVYGKGTHRIVTPTATIGIRGSGAYVEVATNRTYLCTCYGTADLMAASDSKDADTKILETVTTQHHEAPRYITRDAVTTHTRVMPAPMINHTDDELIMLEALMGRVPDFYAQGFSSYK